MGLSAEVIPDMIRDHLDPFSYREYDLLKNNYSLFIEFTRLKNTHTYYVNFFGGKYKYESTYEVYYSTIAIVSHEIIQLVIDSINRFNKSKETKDLLSIIILIYHLIDKNNLNNIFESLDYPEEKVTSYS